MVAVILFGFIGCMLAGWTVGICDKDDKSTKILAYLIALFILLVAIFFAFTWRDQIQSNVVLKHYQIEETTITTVEYKVHENNNY